MSSSDVVIRIDRKGLVLVAALLLVGAGAGLLWSESLTLATTYPSPSGIYNQLVTTGNSGTVAADTTLNRNAGNTLLVPATNASGRVGIGMAPVNKFDVAGNASFTGSVKLGDDTSACTTAKEGTLRWRSGALNVCAAGVWVDVGRSERGTWGGSCADPLGYRDPGVPSHPATSCTMTGHWDSGYQYHVASCASGWAVGGLGCVKL